MEVNIMKRIVGLALVIAIIITSFAGISVFARSGKNAVGNITNGGYAVSDGEYVYYSADGHLYREDVGGGNRKSLVDGDSYESIVIYEDYIYYSTFNLSGSFIYRVDKKGEDSPEYMGACKSTMTFFTIYDGYLYYNAGSVVRKKNLENLEGYVDIANTYDSFAILDDRLYFDNIDSQAGAKGLASVDLDGDNFKTYNIGDISYIIGAYDNKIYYTANGETRFITKKGKEEVIGKTNRLWFNIYDNYIYFIDYDNGRRLSRISLNGKEKEISDLEVYSDLCIVEDKVYRRSADGYKNVIIADLPEFSGSEDEEDYDYNHDYDSDSVFSNVSSWAEEEVSEAYENGLVPEYFEGKDLTRKISRAEFAAVAVQTYETIADKSVSAKSTPFDDISGHELKKDIGKAYRLNVAIGVSDDEFAPDEDITREQLATMLCRVIKKYKYPDWTIDTDDEYYIGGSNVKKFADDNEISDFARDSVYYMYSVGIINGIGNNKFAPKNSTSYQESIDYATATREQAIIMANRIHKKNGEL